MTYARTAQPSSSRRFGRLAAAAAATVLAASLPALVPAAADAVAIASSDAVGDVRYIGADETGFGTAAPTRVEGDIRALRVNLLPLKVRITLSYRSLATTVDGHPMVHRFYYRFRTASLNRRVTLAPGAAKPADRLFLTNAAGKRIPCQMHARVGYDVDQVLLQVPRSCLGTPDWVRVGAGSASVDSTGGGYYDDARANTLRQDLVLGPRIYQVA